MLYFDDFVDFTSSVSVSFTYDKRLSLNKKINLFESQGYHTSVL
jgi:hypothetical protein